MKFKALLSIHVKFQVVDAKKLEKAEAKIRQKQERKAGEVPSRYEAPNK